MRKHTHVQTRRPQYTIVEVGQDRYPALTRFVFDVYFERYARLHDWDGSGFETFATDDQHYIPVTKAWAAVDTRGRTLATIRTIRRTRPATLPIERDFHLDIDAFAHTREWSVNHVFEVARVAKSDTALARANLHPKTGLTIVDDLFGHVVRDTCTPKNNLWTAAIDAAVLTLMHRRGFPFVQMAPAVDYLGSPTIPVALAIEECRNWMRRQQPDSYARYFLDRRADAA